MSSNSGKVHYFHATANSLGGFIEKPLQKIVPSQACSSLPAVGGHAMHTMGAFSFEGVVSCRSTCTRVSGHHSETDGSPWTIVTSVVEGLNILEIVTAERLVAQVSVQHPADGGSPVFSFTGSHFDGLKIGGHDASPAFNSSLLEGDFGTGASPEPITWPLFQKTGRQQAAKLIKSATGNADQWVVDRYGWVAADTDAQAHGFTLCSLMDGVAPALPGKSFGHVMQIPSFGKIVFGEVLAYPTSVQLSMIRAEMGSPMGGGFSVAMSIPGGTTSPP